MNHDEANRKADRIMSNLIKRGCFAGWAEVAEDCMRREIIQVLTDSEPFALALVDPPQPKDWPADYLEQFWAIYPRRIAKHEAAKRLDAIRKIGKVRFQIIMDAVMVYRAETQNTEMRYISHPATWLNKGRWSDAPDAISGHASDGRGEIKNGFLGRLMER